MINLDKRIKNTIDDLSKSKDRSYDKFNLNFNPFPRSGTANIKSSDFISQQLVPVDEKVLEDIFDFISHSLVANNLDRTDQFLSATITGNYGLGKTQLLLFVKFVLATISLSQNNQINPYVIYIDNPGVKLLELIGAIIKEIGEENISKYVWEKIIKGIKSNSSLREQLGKYEYTGYQMFKDNNPDPYIKENSISYKKFLNAFTNYLNSNKIRNEFNETLKSIILRVLDTETGNTTISQYFYQLVSEDYGVNKTWEALSAGNIKQLNGMEAEIIGYIVKLIKSQGYTDFFILVDEFEDITAGRLTKFQIDNYLYNLRTLLDDHRSWCLLFAMTGQALEKLWAISPPLAERITARRIILEKLDDEQAQKITANYLNLAREEESENLSPFDVEGIKHLNSSVDGNTRNFLKNCYYLIEKARYNNDNDGIIDLDFINLNLNI